MDNSIEKAGKSVAVYKRDKMYWVNNALKICYFWLLSERKLGIEKYIHLSELTQRYWIFVNLTL